ncbi:MAG TPA: serine protease [Myxococcales bacterium]|nr:serine protease [Myxococcales bacterium]
MNGLACRALFASTLAATIAGSAYGAVVPTPPTLDMRSVADRVHSLAVAVRTHAFVPATARGENGIAEAVTSTSGVLIGDGLVLTTFTGVSVKRSDGQRDPPAAIEVVTDAAGIVPARFLLGDPQLDLALLQLPDQLHDLEGATLAPNDAAVGDEVIAIGASGDSLYVVGVTLDRVEFATAGGARLYLNRPLPPSFLGGPLFDAEGRLVGVTTEPPSESGFAVPASLLRTLIDRVRSTTRT